MKNVRAGLLIISLLLHTCLPAAQNADSSETDMAGNDDEFSLITIIENPESYKGSPVTMILRLKGFDSSKNILTFYDEENRDIDFDILGWQKNKNLRQYMRSLVKGLRYKVTFQVNDVTDGSVSATVQSFEPLFLEKL